MQDTPSRSARWLVALAALMLAALACNLAGGGAATPVPTPFPTATLPALTPSPQVTATPQFVIVTATPTPTGGAVINRTLAAPTLANCTPQTTWPAYTVVAGDTLSRIAERVGSTVAQLATANCLSNTGLIFVGQRLYVPALPATQAPVATQDPNQPTFRENLAVQPFWLDSASRAVTYSETVRVNAGEVLNADVVDFYVNDPAGGPAVFMGQDVDPWDGAFIDYSFPAAGSYVFQAMARNDRAQRPSTTFSVRYDPNFVPPGGQRNQLTIAPVLGLDGSFHRLAAGSTVTITWPDAPVGALRVNFTLAPTGTGTGQQAQTIGSDLSPADGSAITWGVTVSGSGHIQGVAQMPDGSTQSSELLGIVVG